MDAKTALLFILRILMNSTLTEVTDQATQLLSSMTIENQVEGGIESAAAARDAQL